MVTSAEYERAHPLFRRALPGGEYWQEVQPQLKAGAFPIRIDGDAVRFSYEALWRAEREGWLAFEVEGLRPRSGGPG